MLEVPYRKWIAEQQGQSKNASAVAGLSLLVN